ncbi:hypothetical protein Tco_0161488 [Tanacetum coccineum]
MATCHHLSGAKWHDDCSGTITVATAGPLINSGQRRSTVAVNRGQRRSRRCLDEELEYYHLKELHYSAQCHTQMLLWIISRGVVLLILLMEYKFQVWYIELTSPSDHSNSRKNTRSKLEYKFQDQENSEDIFSFGSALEDFICVVFVPDRNIVVLTDSFIAMDEQAIRPVIDQAVIKGMQSLGRCTDPDNSINEYFELLETPTDQPPQIVGFNLEGDAKTGLPEEREPADLYQRIDDGPSIHKEWSRGIKVFDGESMSLNGCMDVVEVVVKWNDGGEVVELTKVLQDLIPNHEWLGLSTNPISSLREVDWWEEWFKVHGRGVWQFVGGVTHFLGEFLVEEDALEAMLKVIKKGVVAGFSQVIFGRIPVRKALLTWHDLYATLHIERRFQELSAT